MEEQKLLRRKKKTQLGGNRRALAEAYEELASFYFKLGRYEDARDEYQEAAELWAELGLRLQWGAGNRMIGECHMMMAEFEEALQYEQKHLAVAKELNNQVEEQRAMATLGRMYLLQGQSIADAQRAAVCLKAAEKAFMKSLVLCEDLKGKIPMHEIMDMRARLLLNIGVVLEQLGGTERALSFFRKAISICSSQELLDVLHQCHVTEAGLHAKGKDYTKALASFNKALEVAGRLEDKVLKQCETLSLKGDILCRMSDYQSAKQVLLKAWKLDTPDQEEKSDIEKRLKIVAALCYTQDLIVTTESTDHVTLKRLHERLGDGACALRDYSAAADAYLRMLEHAQAAGESGRQLIPIYVSLYQTYKDMGAYEEALQYYEREYELVREEPREAYSTLCGIAEVRHLARRPYEQVEQACQEAHPAAAKLGQKYKIRLLKLLLDYQRLYGESDKADDTRAELKLLGHFRLEPLEHDEGEEGEEGSSGPSQTEHDTPNIGDDICIEDLTDAESDEEAESAAAGRVGGRETRRRGRGFTVKRNAKGETQLHVACISGNELLAERLVRAGHPVNVRDHAGWLPLHEACIHGRLGVARLLLEHGAHLNDRGGEKCDGITPMYDAACNGHLDLVQLLLDKGALPSLLTDFGESPLDALRRWRKENILDKSEEVTYKQICNQIINHLEMRPAQDASKKSISKSPQNVKKVVSPPSTSKSSFCNKSDDNLLPAFKNRNVIDEESDEEINLSQNDNELNVSSDDHAKPKDNNTGVNEYKSAIMALRNRNVSEDLPEVNLEKIVAKPALLDPDEVDDDWLEDDLGSNRNKKRKISGDTLIVTAPKKPSIENVKESIRNINSIHTDLGEKQNKSYSDKICNNSRSRFSDIIDSDNSSDSDNFRMTENINPNSSKPNALNELLRSKTIDLDNSKTSNDSRQNMKKRWKRQTTLLKAGFRRRNNSSEVAQSCSSNSNSDGEISNFRPSNESPKKGWSINRSNQYLPKTSSNKCLSSMNFETLPNISNSNFTRKSSNERLPSTNNKEFVPSSVHPVQAISMMQPGTIIPPAAVRVKIEDKVLLISLNLKTINKLNISWLVEEVKNRYYKLSGVRPTFSLLTSDGAILSEEDPLSLVLTSPSPELRTAVTHWKASPAEERYLDCCQALEIEISEEIQLAIGRSHTTHRLALGSQTLNSAQIKPLFRALTHQTHLTALVLSDNNLRDEGVRSLVDCLGTLKQITLLDISSNGVTSEGTESLLSMFEKAVRPVCQSLDHLDVSGNPIGDAGFRHVLEMSGYVKLRRLRCRACGVTGGAGAGRRASLAGLEVLDLSDNRFGRALLEEVLLRVSPGALAELELDNVGVAGAEVSVFLGKLFEHAGELSMRKFNLSNCGLTDGDFMKFYRYLSRAKSLQSMTLRHNALTFITLKKLLRREPPVPRVDLEGCADAFKYCHDSDFPVWLPALPLGRCVPELRASPPTASAASPAHAAYRAFCRLWLGCFGGRGVVEQTDGGVVNFTAK